MGSGVQWATVHGSQRMGHNWSDWACTSLAFTYFSFCYPYLWFSLKASLVSWSFLGLCLQKCLGICMYIWSPLANDWPIPCQYQSAATLLWIRTCSRAKLIVLSSPQHEAEVSFWVTLPEIPSLLGFFCFFVLFPSFPYWSLLEALSKWTFYTGVLNAEYSLRQLDWRAFHNWPSWLQKVACDFP